MSTDLAASALVPIGDGDFPVLARDLHRFLEVKTKYADWFKDAVKHVHPLDCGPEVFPQKEKNSKGGRPKLDRSISLNGAKKIAMMAKTHKGDQARDYFLECERRAYAPAPMSDAEIMSRALVLAHATIAKVEGRAIAAESLAEDRNPAQDFVDDLTAGEGSVITKEALNHASVPGFQRLTRAPWDDIDQVFMTHDTGERRFLKTWVTRGIGENKPTTVRTGRGQKPGWKIVNTPRWTRGTGVLTLREHLLIRQKQKRLGL